MLLSKFLTNYGHFGFFPFLFWLLCAKIIVFIFIFGIPNLNADEQIYKCEYFDDVLKGLMDTYCLINLGTLNILKPI